MRYVKRNLAISSAVGALTLTCAFALGSPLFVNPAVPAAEVKASKDKSKSQTFDGVIMKAGNSYVLEGFDGNTYYLDNDKQAEAYASNYAKVTGQLNEETHTIHVERIGAL